MNQVEGKEDMAFVTRPFGKNTVVAFVSGDLGRRIERMGDERATKLALKNMKRLFGDAVKDNYVGSTATRWGQNPYTEGSYAYLNVRDLTKPFAEDEAKSPKEAKTGKKIEWHEADGAAGPGRWRRSQPHLLRGRSGRHGQSPPQPPLPNVGRGRTSRRRSRRRRCSSSSRSRIAPRRPPKRPRRRPTSSPKPTSHFAGDDRVPAPRFSSLNHQKN